MDVAKPHRIAVLLPSLRLDEASRSLEGELELLLWVALADALAPHPELAVLALDAMDVQRLGDRFVPLRARRGAETVRGLSEGDRRDELLWLEAPLGAQRAGLVRLHVQSAATGERTFEALGRELGVQVGQVVAAWLSEDRRAAMPAPFEGVAEADVLEAGRGLAAALRAAAPPPAARATGQTSPWLVPRGTPESDDGADDDDGEAPQSDGGDTAAAAPSDAPSDPLTTAAALLAEPLKVAGLRALGLALGRDVSALLAELAPDHPAALTGGDRNTARLRRALVVAPGDVTAYLALTHDADDEEAAAPSPFEDAAAAAMASLLAPGQRGVARAAGRRLRDCGLLELGLRLADRSVAQDPNDSARHLDLLDLYPGAERLGSWLEQSHASSFRHGCPMEPYLPWFPDQILVDLAAATALMNVGRLDEAIALRANRLEGREGRWPRHTRILTRWRKNPRFVAWCYAREGYFRGEDGRVVEGFGRIEPDDGVDLGMFLDGLVALGREHEVPLAWAHFGRGLGYATPFARLSAGRALMAAGRWREGLEELVRVELTAPMRDDQVALAHALRLLAAAPLADLEAAISDQLDAGAQTLARRFARNVADFVPGAAEGQVVTAALGSGPPVDFDTSWLASWPPETPGRAAIDALFAEADSGPGAAQARADALVNRWPQVLFVEASAEQPTRLAQATAYVGAQALARYLAVTTRAPSPLAGGLRTVAAEALDWLAATRSELALEDVSRVLATLEPAVASADPGLASAWIATLERCLQLDERTFGGVGALARPTPSIAALVAGPEELAVLAWRGAHLVRERPDGWANEAAAVLERVAWVTGGLGASEWAEAADATADAVSGPPSAARLDALLSAAFLAEGRSWAPALLAGRALFEAGLTEAAFSTLCDGLGALPDAFREPGVGELAPLWNRSGLDVPFAFGQVAAGVFESLQQGNGPRAARLGRWALALDAGNAEGHRNVGLAWAYQGNVARALEHLVRGTPEQATQILSGVLYQTGRTPEAMAVLDYASRWYVRADQWLTYGGVAYAAMDNPRTLKAYGLAYRLDPDAFDASMYNAWAGVLDEVGDYDGCERVAQRLLDLAGDDPMWLTNGWHHLACAYLGQRRFEEAAALAERALEHNPLPDNTPIFEQTLAKARAGTPSEVPPMEATEPAREPVFALVESGELAEAASLLNAPDWRVKRAALRASRFRYGSESRLAVTPRAREAAERTLAESAGTLEAEPSLVRALALELRAQATCPRDPVPFLGDRMTREAFYQEFRARGGVVLGEAPPPAQPFVDREVLPGTTIPTAGAYVALLADLAALRPADALARHALDDASYLDVARAWAAALDEDPELAATIEAGLHALSTPG